MRLRPAAAPAGAAAGRSRIFSGYHPA